MKLCGVFAGVLLASAAANADLFVDFEAPTYVGDADGELLTLGFGGGGQDSWYNPVNGSADFNVHSYAGNTHGFVANPGGGGEQFIVGRFGATHARAQRNTDFSSASTWTISYDVNNIFSGPTAANNIGSFSLQDSTVSQSFIALNRYIDVANPTGWHASYNVYDAGGVAQTSQEAGDEWRNLQFNHWYRQTTEVDFATHAIVSVSITDLHTGTTTTVNPVGWYLQGGANSALPVPTGFRCFNSGNASNIGGWDNISIVPAPATGSALAIGLLAFRRRRA